MKKPDFNVNCGFCGVLFCVKRKNYLKQTALDKNHIFCCSKICRLEKSKTGKIINCFLCNKEVYKALKDLKKGAKFCSRSCSATSNNKIRLESGFTTKGKTKTLICSKCKCEFFGSVHTPPSTGLCNICYNYREYNCIDCNAVICGSRSGKKYCDSCREKSVSSKMQVRIDTGLLYSKSIKCEFAFNDKKIRCDSKLEYVCLSYFQSEYDVLDMRRAQLKLPYLLDSKTKSYYPDFEIVLKDGTKYLVECKGVVGKKLSEKWNDYNRKSIEKKKVLESWCIENDYISYWFDQQKHEKIYKNTKIDV